LKFAPTAIPAMALLQQHDDRRDVVIKPAARRRVAIEARGHSELRAFGTRGGAIGPYCLLGELGTAISLSLGIDSRLGSNPT